MTDVSEIDRRVRFLVHLGTGLDFDQAIIRGNDDRPAPRGLHASVLRIDDRQMGMKDIKYEIENDTVIAAVTAWQRATYDIQFYREQATDTATRFQLWLGSPLALINADRQAVSIGNYGPVQRLDHMIADETEERAGIDIEVDYVYSYRQDVGRLVEVPFTVSGEGLEGTAAVRHD